MTQEDTMLLHRLASSIRKQDWFTVFIEIVIVVVGIFIGLQVDDWKDARADRREEQNYLLRIQGELTEYIADFEAARDRRSSIGKQLVSFSDVLFGRVPRDELTNEECGAIGSSNILQAYVAELPVLTELASSGHMHLLQDEELRATIVATQQARENLLDLMAAGNLHAFNLRSRYPELIQVESYYDEQRQNVRNASTCNLAGMRASQAFKNDASTNLDLYDTFNNIRLKVYGDQLAKLKQAVDAAL